MRFQSLVWQEQSGWTPALDSLSSGGQNTWVLAVGTGETVPRSALSELRDRFPEAAFTACSTAGGIRDGEVTDDPLIALIVDFEHTKPIVISERISDHADSASAGRSVANKALATQSELGLPLAAILVFSDGLLINGTGLVAGMVEVLPNTPISGGLAGDESRFKHTWVDDGQGPQEGIIAALALYGSRLTLSHGSEGGWEAFGPTRKVTRSQDNVLYELDGRPALELYRDYLGDRVDELPASALLFPLALVDDPENILTRTVLGIDEDAQSMTFAGDIPTGSSARLMRTSMERLIDGAQAAAQASSGSSRAQDGGQTLALAVSCVGRRLVLGQRTDEELEAVLNEIPAATLIGFYSYGEISPAAGYCSLHNQTMTLTLLSEEP